MSLTLFLSMVGVMFVGSFTPGPNNIMLASSGAHFGFMRTAPHISGVVVGFMGVLLLTGLGLEQIFKQFPLLQQVLRVAALIFILFLAWKIAGSRPASGGSSSARPQYFLQATAFQAINPKGITMAISVVSTFISPHLPFMPQFLAMFAAFFVVTLLSAVAWTGFGLVIKRLIQTPKVERLFSITMALLLILSIMPVVLDLFR